MKANSSNEVEPLVTVVALCYNQEKYVDETLESIRNQTYRNIELIICDDYSTDNSRKRISDWVLRNNYKAKILFDNKNNGITKSLNHVINEATGAYITFIACDDVMMPDKISIQLHELLSLDSDYLAVYSDAQLINEDSNNKSDTRFIESFRANKTVATGALFEDLKTGNFIPGASLLFKMETFTKVGLFDEHLKYEDWDYLLRLSKHYKIHFSNYTSVKYRFHAGNYSKSSTHLLNERYEEFRIAMKHQDHPYFAQRSRTLLINGYLRGYYRLNEMIEIYKSNVGDNTLLKIISLKLPFKIFKAINRLIS